MDVRDAVEADADRLASLTEAPQDVMRNLVHDRTVRVAVGDEPEAKPEEGNPTGSDSAESDGDTEPAEHATNEPSVDTEEKNEEKEEEEEEKEEEEEEEEEDAAAAKAHRDAEAIRGFVSFDARKDTVHVTQLDGDPDTFRRLLAEPINFADAENMDVELLVPESETALGEAADAMDFSDVGSGPRFGGEPTRRYRLELQ